ncbi:MAG: BatD family protein, partial [Opitutaceae bacterium]
MRFVRLFFPVCSVLVLAVAVHAQSVRWEPSEAGLPNTVVLVFENCEPDGQPELPGIPGVTFTSLGRSESSQSTFGAGGFTTVRTIALSYVVRGRQNTPVQIPAFTVKTNKGPMRVDAFNATAPAAPVESVASARLIPERTSVWAGEVFGLSYELSASRRTNPQISPTFEWNAPPLVAEDWSKPEVTEAVVSGERRVNVLFRTRAVAKTPATLKLEAANHLLSIQTGTIGFGIISQPRMEQVSVTSDQPTMQVRALPNAPSGFSGAVGQFKLTSKVVPVKAAVGEPVTWTLELTGTGNWPEIAGLPARDVSNDFQVVQPKAKRTPVEGKLFEVALAEDVVLVPTKAGSYALGPVNFTYFDPRSGSYKTITAPRTTVAITAANISQFGTSPQPARTEPLSTSGNPPAPPAAPSAPTAIPRDPLSGSDETGAPMAVTTLVQVAAIPFVGLLGFWFWLATERARQTDPVRPRREARDRLARTLGQLHGANDQARSGLILAWQRDTAVLWKLSHAAPRAAALPDDGWSGLWAEADRALYGPDTRLPSDWIARAQAALAAIRVPGFKWTRLFRPQNLMPFAALVAVMFIATTATLRAAELDAMAAYRKGDFAAAEKGWHADVEKRPTDWIARHNLSLALAQQQRAGEAAAQAAAAFVQKPNDASVRWHFALVAEKAGVAPATLAAFIEPGPLESIGRMASPGRWQLLIIVAAWGIAAAIGRLLANAYGRGAQSVRWAALSALALSLVLGGVAVAGVKSYGIAANAASVIVARPALLRSIPTEVDTSQKTSPLAVGSVALTDKTFLGWRRLAFENGQTGWVRKED